MAKRASYAGEPYWGRPIPGWGSPTPAVLIVGLAPAAHGANRTGRVFTGDRSGDWLFASLHRVGLATRGTSVDAADGLELVDTRMVATVRCAPPQNKPSTAERDTCAPWIEAELAPLGRARPRRRGARLDRLGRDAALVPGRRLAAPHTQAAVRPRRRGRPSSAPAGRSRCSAATTRASRTPSPAGSPRRCSTRCSGGPRLYADRAPVSQPAEEVALKATGCGFESHRGHQPTRPLRPALICWSLRGRACVTSRPAVAGPQDRIRGCGPCISCWAIPRTPAVPAYLLASRRADCPHGSSRRRWLRLHASPGTLTATG